MKIFLNCFLISMVVFSACKINRYSNGKRVGKWVEKQSLNGNHYLFIGHYKKNGIERGTWRNFRNDTLVSREHYNENVSTIKNYYDNGTLLSTGKSTIDRSDPKLLHWFYNGEWRFYNKSGFLEYIRVYKNGQEINEISIKGK